MQLQGWGDGPGGERGGLGGGERGQRGPWAVGTVVAADSGAGSGVGTGLGTGTGRGRLSPAAAPSSSTTRSTWSTPAPQRTSTWSSRPGGSGHSASARTGGGAWEPCPPGAGAAGWSVPPRPQTLFCVCLRAHSALCSLRRGQSWEGWSARLTVTGDIRLPGGPLPPRPCDLKGILIFIVNLKGSLTTGMERDPAPPHTELGGSREGLLGTLGVVPAAHPEPPGVARRRVPRPAPRHTSVRFAAANFPQSSTSINSLLGVTLCVSVGTGVRQGAQGRGTKTPGDAIESAPFRGFWNQVRGARGSSPDSCDWPERKGEGPRRCVPLGEGEGQAAQNLKLVF